jgi:RimJ/RimL family protein N-acetyltransferase/GNAT superfamily N-acetyltransferase
MKTIIFRPAEPDRDFGQLAAWFSTLEDERTTESGLKEYFEKQEKRIAQQVAEDERGELMGFYWLVRDKSIPDRSNFDLFVKPEHRGQGIGRRLYEGMVRAAMDAGTKKLRVTVRDHWPECRAFAERRGFKEVRHHFGMSLDLDAFDDRPYDGILTRLKDEGFRFTSMEELGNTEDAQRMLYTLNDTAASTTPGTDGEHAWVSFEDFQKSVCQSDWYKPDGQLVVIDKATGAWAAMSAITRMEGNDYAYNLFTGVDMSYRGRKLAQAVKILALRYAREVLKVHTVRTHHNTKNQPMIAIDRKLGYVQMPGTFLMEKKLE